jgi:hypothetical protein
MKRMRSGFMMESHRTTQDGSPLRHVWIAFPGGGGFVKLSPDEVRALADDLDKCADEADE